MVIKLPLKRAGRAAAAFALVALLLLAGRGRALRADAAQRVPLPILMYHHILRDGTRHNKYTISPDEFKADLQFLADQGYQTVTVAQLLAFVREGVPLPPKPVMLTFDDGYESFYAYAYPLLQEYGFCAVYTVIGRYADAYTDHEDHNLNYAHCTWEQLDELQKSGLVEIGNHSYDLHTYDRGRRGSMRVSGESADAYEDTLRQDLGRLQAQCRMYLGWEPVLFAYPFGYISTESLDTLKDMGFQVALTCNERINLLDGSAEQLYALGRFNRPHGRSAQEIFRHAGL
ncbi:MAG: polysaccharide deacetylase family protein [Clostridiales bacterium]|nr:polysaccharide deacetylase family protein [Clostridiales bacterium]